MKGEHMNLYPAVGSTVFRLKRSFSALVSLFRYSLETHPECFRDSNTQGCLTLHFANNRNEKRAKPLKTTLPTAVFMIRKPCCGFGVLIKTDSAYRVIMPSLKLIHWQLTVI